MARFVLVHGAYGGAWGWEPVIGGLEAGGHTAEAFDLPGAGDDRTPVAGVTLDACVERVCGVLAARPEPAILVGHSMGGIVITQSAARCPDRIALLVYVCAFLPADGQSLLDLTRLPEGADDQIQANLVVVGDPPVAELSAEATREAVYNCCTDEQAAWAVERRRPQPVAVFTTPVSLGDAVLPPRTYVICTRDNSIPPALQRRMVRERPCADVVELDTDHAPFLSRTVELVAALERFAGLAGAGELRG
jgi:pimeloyl-ACP methyl ester carboxylesterase